MAMKNVVLVSTELGVGGAENALTQIAVRLPNHGFCPTLVSLRPRPQPGRDSLVIKLEQAKLAVQCLDITRPTQFFSAVSALRRICDETDARIVLSFLYHANVIAAFAASRRPRLRHLAGIRVAEPNAWRNRIEAWALRRCDGVICVSEAVQRNLLRYFADPARVSVIPNGVAAGPNTPAVNLSSIGIAEGDRVMLFVGRLHPQKGLDWALPAIARVLASKPNLHLVILGDGPQAEALERLALTLPGHERIHFLGFQSDLAGYFARASCLILPSRWEGLPNVVLEAMAAGLPVLASDRSNADEIFNSKSSSQLFAFGNEKEFVEKLSRLVSDEAFAKQIGAENREKSQQFSWDAIAEKYAQRLAANS